MSVMMACAVTLKIVKRCTPTAQTRDVFFLSPLFTWAVAAFVSILLFMASSVGVIWSDHEQDNKVTVKNSTFVDVIKKVGWEFMVYLVIQLGLTIGVLSLFWLDYNPEHEEERAACQLLLTAQQVGQHHHYGAIPAGGGGVPAAGGPAAMVQVTRTTGSVRRNFA